MKFSLILCTLNRVKEITVFFQSLSEQMYKNYEVILVDQNEDNRLDELVKEYSSIFKIVHIKSLIGLSIARNKGLKYVTGEIIGFPDDDCIYSKNILSEVKKTFDQSEYDFISTNSKDFYSEKALLKFPNKEVLMKGSIYNIIGTSCTLFFKKIVIQRVGEFDRELGVGGGTPYGAGEETDYVIRAIKNGFVGNYYPNLFIYHPAKELVYNKETFKRALLYGGGSGRVARKHYNIYYQAKILITPLIKVMLAFPNSKKMKFISLNFLGRLRGFLF